jgi:DNA-binding CsgD family transcriptional regulator
VHDRHDRTPVTVGLRAYVAAAVREGQLGDLRFVNATDPTHVGCMFLVPSATRIRWTPRETHRWKLVAAHIAAGLRVRRRLLETPKYAPGAVPEAVLRPDGHLEHAETPAQGELARTVLQRSAAALDRARGRLRREDTDEALTIWEGLIAGRWSLVDHVDSDGRRLLLAHRNDPGAPDVRGLSLRERQVLSYVALGHSNKVIAYELGLTTSTVAGHLARAREKLGLRSLAALREALTLAGPAITTSEGDPPAD